MKQLKIIDSYKLMETLADIQDLSQKEQWNIYQLRKTLRPHFDFQVEREDAIRDKYRVFADADGNLEDEKATEFVNELNELNNMEIELKEFTRPKIRMVKGISFLTAENLEDFIEFIPG